MENCSGKFYVKITLLYIICDKFKISPQLAGIPEAKKKHYKNNYILKKAALCSLIFIIAVSRKRAILNVTLTGCF